MVKCEHCKDEFEHYDTVCINHGIEGKEFRICYGCKDEAVNSGKIIQCDACGEYFTADVLHDEEIEGHTIVETEYDLSADDYDNDDCRYYFDCCRSAAYRKYAAEIRKINRFMEKLGKAYGFEELVCTGRFSNGEAMFAPASNSRARLYAAIA